MFPSRLTALAVVAFSLVFRVGAVPTPASVHVGKAAASIQQRAPQPLGLIHAYEKRADLDLNTIPAETPTQSIPMAPFSPILAKSAILTLIRSQLRRLPSPSMAQYSHTLGRSVLWMLT